MLGRSGRVQTLSPLRRKGVQWVWRGQKGGCWRCWSCRSSLKGRSWGAPFPSIDLGMQGLELDPGGDGRSWVPRCPTAPSPQSLQKTPAFTFQLPPRPCQVTLSPSTSQEQLPLPSNGPHPCPAGPGGPGGREGTRHSHGKAQDAAASPGTSTKLAKPSRSGKAQRS